MTAIPDPDIPPRVVDPPPDGGEPVIPEPDPTHSPVLPEPEPERPVEPKPTAAARQARETDDVWPAVGVGPVTRAMAKGAVLWGAAGAAAGAVIGVLLAVIPFADLPFPGRAALLGGVGLIAGSTAGFIYGGGRQSELEDDVGNQVGPAPLLEKNRDPERVRRAVEDQRRSGSPIR
jgi:hypothetical protein